MNEVELVEKICARIKNSKRLFVGNRFWGFDDLLTIDKYNGIFKVEKDSIVLGQFSSGCMSILSDKTAYNKIRDAIEMRTKQEKEKILKEL